jgi:16S rRNA (cytosine967-C5)-methyltransferase
MRYILQHIKIIIEEYKGDVPLTHFLKHYFKWNPKLGSRDRKILSEMAYCWYRCSKAVAGIDDFEKKLQICLFLSNTENNFAAYLLPEEWKENKHLPLTEKIAVVAASGISVDLDKLIDYKGALSKGVERNDWERSLLQQPALFIRIRKNKDKIIALLSTENIAYKEIDDDCLMLPNGAAIDKLLQADTYVIQDASSQITGSFFQAQVNEQWWDCCSGAGGKSLLLKDRNKAVKLTVTDKRKTILHNLQERFALYGHKLQQASVLDMSDPNAIKRLMQEKVFDNIICDVPCTGSGTWARTPEQAYYFDEEDMDILPDLQYTIASNAATYLKAGGTLYYITCSVFQKENEDVVARIIGQTGLRLKEMQLVNGIAGRADCLFIAALQKQ